MDKPRTFSVKNFDKFQHYKHRSPPWIKLYNSVLDDYAFTSLPDTARAHLVAIWLLASRMQNVIPFDAEWVSRAIKASDKVNLVTLEDAGFILQSPSRILRSKVNLASARLAPRIQNACLERETETEREGETERESITVASATIDKQFEAFWKAYPKRDGSNPKQPARKIFAAALKSGHKAEQIIAGAERYTAFMQSKGNVGTPYVAQAQTWLRQARWDDELTPAPPSTNGHAPVSQERIEGVWRGYLEKEKAFGYWPSLNNPKHEIPREFIAKWEAEQTATAGAK